MAGWRDGVDAVAGGAEGPVTRSKAVKCGAVARVMWLRAVEMRREAGFGVGVARGSGDEGRRRTVERRKRTKHSLRTIRQVRSSASWWSCMTAGGLSGLGREEG